MTQAAILAASGSPGTTTGFKNRIINGNMVIDQRNAGASVTIVGGPYTLDRWKAYSSPSSKYSVQQNAGSVTPPAGFTNYLGCTSLSAYSITSGDYFFLMQRVEGYNIADLAWGTANAKTVTVSFWVYSSLTGTFGGVIQNDNSDRSYPFTYTISAANTWEQKSVTIAGPTSGTWLTTNGTGLSLLLGLGVGSTYSGTAGIWGNANYLGATGATSVVGTNGATFYLTGVQLEVGTTATNFDFRSYGTELSLCQRYYETMGYGLLGIANSATGIWAQMIYKVQKRATPTVGLYTTTQTWGQFGIANRDSTGVSIGDSAKTNAWGSVTRIEGFSSITTNAPLGSLTDTVFTLSAEL
jgi:hypothetical protein